jgi:hypothetical protein
MSRPFVPRLPLDAAVSDPPVRLVHLESLYVFHVVFLARQSKAQSCSRQGLWPWRPWTDDHERRIPSSAEGESGCADRRIMFNAEQTHILLTIQSFAVDLRGQRAADG